MTLKLAFVKNKLYFKFVWSPKCSQMCKQPDIFEYMFNTAHICLSSFTHLQSNQTYKNPKAPAMLSNVFQHH